MSSNSTDNYDKDNSSVDGFFVSLGINAAIFIALMSIFIILRPWKLTPRLLNLRRYFNARIKGVKHANTVLPYKKVPVYEEVDPKKLGNRRIPFGSWSWVWPSLWSYHDKRFLRTHGADALMYIVFLRNAMALCICLALPALVVILPVNTQGGNDNLPESNKNYATGMGKITMGNVDSNSSLLTTHVVFTYVFSILMYLFVIITYKQYVWIRKAWMNQNCSRAYTIMVEEIPHNLKTDEALYEFFTANFPGKVMAAHIAYDTQPVRDMMDKRKKYIKKYENACNKKDHKTLAGIPWPKFCCGGKYGPEEPRTTTGVHGWFGGIPHVGADVNAKEYFKRKIMKYERLIADVQADPSSQLKKTRVGFVTFNTPFFARAKVYGQMGSLVKPSRKDWTLLNMTVNPAPEPTDVRWASLTVNRWSYLLRGLIITIIIIFIIFFWFVPTLFITSVTNLQALSQINGLGWLSWINDTPGFVRGLIQGFLPPLALYILGAIVYPLIKLMCAKLQGVHVQSKAMRHVLVAYWGFLLLNVLFVVTIGGAVFQVLQQVIDDPISIFSLLSKSLPQQSLFFMLYILTTGVAKEPIALFRIGNAFKWTIKLMLAKNKKQRNFAQIPGSVDYAKNLAFDLLIFVIVAVYCVLSPLVPAFGIMYYGIVFLVSRHNIIYTNVSQWESGALFWRYMFHIIFFGILLFQAVILGIFSVGQSYISPALVPPIIITILLWALLWWSWGESSYYGTIKACGSDRFTFQEIFRVEYIDPALRQDYICAYRFGENGPQPECPTGRYGSNFLEKAEMEDVRLDDDDEWDEAGKDKPMKKLESSTVHRDRDIENNYDPVVRFDGPDPVV